MRLLWDLQQAPDQGHLPACSHLQCVPQTGDTTLAHIQQMLLAQEAMLEGSDSLDSPASLPQISEIAFPAASTTRVPLASLVRSFLSAAAGPGFKMPHW